MHTKTLISIAALIVATTGATAHAAVEQLNCRALPNSFAPTASVTGTVLVGPSRGPVANVSGKLRITIGKGRSARLDDRVRVKGRRLSVNGIAYTLTSVSDARVAKLYLYTGPNGGSYVELAGGERFSTDCRPAEAGASE